MHTKKIKGKSAARLLDHAWAPCLATCLVGLSHSSTFLQDGSWNQPPNDGRGPLLGGPYFEAFPFFNLECSLGPRTRRLARAAAACTRAASRDRGPLAVAL